MNLTPVQATVEQNADAVLLARVRNISGAYLLQADLSGIQLTVYDRSDGMAVVWTGSLTVSSVVFDALQPYDGILWTVDRVGYNFKVRVNGQLAFPLATNYRVDAVFTMTDSSRFAVQWDLATQAVP